MMSKGIALQSKSKVMPHELYTPLPIACTPCKTLTTI